jgi:competence protein ComEC
MLDIGQGDCNVVTVGSGKTLMIDCGSSSEKEIGRYIVIPFLKYNGINTVDTVILTHADSDHINGLEEMLSMSDTGGIRIRNLIIPGEKNMNEKFIRLQALAKSKGIRCLTFNAGDFLKAGMADLNCLSPEKGFSAEDENEYSIVLKLTYGDFSGLFTGDVQGTAEEKLISKLDFSNRLTLLKVAHHGSRNSTPSKFLNKVRPKYSLISVCKHSRYHHPHKELIERLRNVGTDIHSTADEGAITVKTNGKTIKITGEKNEKD